MARVLIGASARVGDWSTAFLIYINDLGKGIKSQIQFSDDNI